ncbi:MAG TPA: DUF2782 domain-containing protein [Noviherbaspirillum sp.]|uniref:DUF2782 domain-containing protein n=1 Tax=Noviherbaspirillum sp. TaxID=1926288 RepID=UPI002F9385B1
MNMRSLSLPALAAACIAAYAISTPALAQKQPGADAPPPPQMEKLEEGEEPAVTIRQPEQQKRIEEKRGPGGKVTEVKVTTGGSTYYLKPNDQAGSALPGEAQSNTARAAQWEVKTFDLIPHRDPQEAQAERAAQEATPAPPAAQEAK